MKEKIVKNLKIISCLVGFFFSHSAFAMLGDCMVRGPFAKCVSPAAALKCLAQDHKGTTNAIKEALNKITNPQQKFVILTITPSEINKNLFVINISTNDGKLLNDKYNLRDPNCLRLLHNQKVTINAEGKLVPFAG